MILFHFNVIIIYRYIAFIAYRRLLKVFHYYNTHLLNIHKMFGSPLTTSTSRHWSVLYLCVRTTYGFQFPIVVFLAQKQQKQSIFQGCVHCVLCRYIQRSKNHSLLKYGIVPDKWPPVRFASRPISMYAHTD